MLEQPNRRKTVIYTWINFILGFRYFLYVGAIYCYLNYKGMYLTKERIEELGYWFLMLLAPSVELNISWLMFVPICVVIILVLFATSCNYYISLLSAGLKTNYESLVRTYANHFSTNISAAILFVIVGIAIINLTGYKPWIAVMFGCLIIYNLFCVKSFLVFKEEYRKAKEVENYGNYLGMENL